MMDAKYAFISHSSKNKDTADNIVNNLEQNGISCWIAPRDIPAGINYGAAISKGLRNCAVLVLVYSEDSNASVAVSREVQMAFENSKHIIPVRIDKTPVSHDLDFFLSGIQWVDASPEDIQFDKLIDSINRLLKTPYPTPNFAPNSISNLPSTSEEDATLFLGMEDELEEAKTLTLRNVNNPTQAWSSIIEGDVIVGRQANSQICLLEPSISRVQCKIYQEGSDMIIENLSRSNITILNDTPLGAPCVLNVGDKIKCGRVVLAVE